MNRNKLVEDNLKLAKQFARGYGASNMEAADLEQEAYLGLLDAAETYDPSRGKFSTFARWHVKKRIMEAIHRDNDIIRTPRRRSGIRCSSLDFEDVQTIADSRKNFSEFLEESERESRIRDTLKQLPDREAIVIRCSYGIGTDKLTLKKIGAILGISAQGAQMIRVRAEEKLVILFQNFYEDQ